MPHRALCGIFAASRRRRRMAKGEAEMEESGREGLMRIGELAHRAGVSARMLRHYDEIGLLRPACVTQAGYRLYDGAALTRLLHIRYLRALEFPLEEVERMLAGTQRDTALALSRHRELMRARRAQIDAILDQLDRAIEENAIEPKEEKAMEKTTEHWEQIRRQYADEARERWGDTQAYKESERRAASRTRAQEDEALAEMDAILEAFANARDQRAEGEQAQALVSRLQAHITARYYDCTDEILAGLGAMYVQDERFRKNIDRFGEGTAAFMSRAIAHHCAAARD